MADTNLNQFLQSLMERLDERSTDPYSESLLKDIAESIQLQTSILRDQVVKDTEMIAVQKAFKNALSEMGIKTSTEFKGSLSAVIDAIKSSIREKGNQYTLEDISKVLSNLLATKMAVSLKMENRGEKGAPLSDVASKKTEQYLKEISQHMGANVVLINSWQERFLRFVKQNQEEHEKNRKDRKMFGYQLLDALEKSKFIGGALRDTVRLFGLMGARWLSQFGPVGRWVGGIFYALSEVLGPFIVQGILRGMGNLFARYIPMLLSGIGKGIGGALLGAAVKGQGALMGFSQWGNLTPYGKALTVGRTAGALGAATIGFAGAGLAFGQMKDSWQQGRKGNATAFGLGGALLGAGGIAAIAALFTAAAAPFIAPLLGIGAAVAGIALFWKKFGGNITSWIGEHKEFIGKILKIVEFLFPPIKMIRMAVEWIKDHLPSWMKGEDEEKDPSSSVGGPFGKGGKGSDATLLKDKTDSTGHLSLQKMTSEDWKKADTLEPVYGNLGEIKNLGQMSQKRAAEVIKADIAKKGNKSYYEIGDRSLVDKSQFLTDVADKDNVYFVRGTNDRVRNDLEKLRAAGFDTSKAKITAGIGTLGSPERMSPHTYRDSVRGHFGTTQSIDVSAIYKDGRKATWGEYSKFLSPMAFGQTESDHEHWAYGKYKWMEDEEKAQKEAAKEAKALQNTKDMMEVQHVIDKLSPEQKAQVDAVINGSDKPVDKEKLLKDLFGIHKSDTIKGNPWVVDERDIRNVPTGTSALLWDPTGNDQFTEQATQILANGGT